MLQRKMSIDSLRKFNQIGILLILISIGSAVDSAKILGLFTSPSVSHHIINKALMKALASKGHEVTFVSMFSPESTNSTTLRQINVASVEDLAVGEKIREHLMKKADTGENAFIGFYQRNVAMAYAANKTLNHPAMQQLMKEETFDLLIFGWLMNDFVLGVSGHFKCPSVVLSTLPAFKTLRDYVGNPLEITHSPTILFGLNNPFVFLDRLKIFAANIIENVLFSIIEFVHHEPLYKSNFPSDKYPSLDEIRKNVSLVLLNYHFSQGAIRSYVPGMVEVGGLHINTDPKPLPQDIQDFLDDAPHGVIYFSLGSNLKSHLMSPDKRAAILHGFTTVKAKILMKWETDELPNKPVNVMIKKWLPQEDILNHRNVRLFISHCGGGSTNEAIYYGIPVLGIPIFADQFGNLKGLEDNGMATGLPYISLNKNHFAAILNESLANPKYYRRAQQISRIYKDRPQRPLDTAIYWIEYILRHHGAKHIQSPTVQFGFLEYYSLDIFIFLMALCTSVWFTLKVIYRICNYFVLGFCKIKID